MFWPPQLCHGFSSEKEKLARSKNPKCGCTVPTNFAQGVANGLQLVSYFTGEVTSLEEGNKGGYSKKLNFLLSWPCLLFLLIMSLSLDDKLLGEKVENYCSSSEDEGENDSSDETNLSESKADKPTFIPESKIQEYKGSCTNTGPKGVINDWREFKRLETEQREEQEKERQQLMRKLQMTCR